MLQLVGIPHDVDRLHDPVLELEGGGGPERDELYMQAKTIILRERKASTSYIQRVLKIGYNRAATIIEQLEKDGIVSAASATGKREVLGD